MDKFQKKMEQMEHMDEKERDRMMDTNKEACICPDCGSYNDCARENDELLYCIVGKSVECISEEVECTCPDCPVTERMGLDNMYYCTRGTEKEQREK